MKAKGIKIVAILIVTILLIPSAYAATLCLYKGPDTSEHDLQLSDFEVSGDSPVSVDDKITVEFKLKNVGKYAVTFDDKKGVFVAAKDPDGWHSCQINVEAKSLCPEGCECLTEAQAKELRYEYCEGEKIVCGYDQYQKPMYCYEKPAVTPSPSPSPTPTPTPVVTPIPTPTPSKEDTTPPTVSTRKIPEKPKLGDRVRYEVKANDPSGIGLTEIWMNGEMKRTCFGPLCSYTSPPIKEDPEFGAFVIDTGGNVKVRRGCSN